jgi:Domain of unknown function (DUF4232)
MKLIGSRLVRWGAVACVAATVLGLAEVAVASDGFASVRSAPARLPRCRTADLRLWVVPETLARHHGGGMNHQGATIALTDVGRRTCRVYGYPGAAMVGLGGGLVPPARTVRGATWYAADQGPHTIVLRPGRSAYAELSWTSADGVSPAVQVEAIAVTPPDERSTLRASLSTILGGDGRLRISALTAAPARLAG